MMRRCIIRPAADFRHVEIPVAVRLAASAFFVLLIGRHDATSGSAPHLPLTIFRDVSVLVQNRNFVASQPPSNPAFNGMNSVVHAVSAID